jgi:hypothetical protein
MSGIDSFRALGTVRSFTNGLAEIGSVPTPGDPDGPGSITVGTAVGVVSGAQETTFAHDGGTDQMYAAIAVFQAASATPTPTNTPVIGSGSVVADETSVSGDFTAGTNTGDPVTSYEIRVDSGGWLDIGLPDPLEFTYSGLSGGTLYNSPGVELRAVNGAGAGPISTPVTFTTTPVSPQVPINLAVTSLLSNSAVLNWERGL